MKEKSNINNSQTQGAMHCFLFDPSVYISILVSMEGDLTAEEIKKAVEKTYTQNETTMSKIILDEGNVYFQKIPETGCKTFVDRRPWQDIMHESEKNTFRIDAGELVRSYIIPQETGCSLLIIAHHIMGDGKALIMLLEDILCNLTGKEVTYRPLNREGTEKIPSDLKLPFVAKNGIKALNGLWKKSGTIFTWQDYYDVHKSFWHTNRSEVQFEVIEKDEFSEMKATCKKWDITVNSYIVTKLLQRHPEYENFCCPISLRGTNRSISNHVALLRMPYKYQSKKTFEENAKKVHKIIKQNMEDEKKKYFISLNVRNMEPTLLDSALMYAHGGYKNKVSKMIAGLMGYVGEKTTHLSVTNLQTVELEKDYGTFRLKDIAIMAACMSATRNVACVSTFQDKMTITHCNVKNA